MEAAPPPARWTEAEETFFPRVRWKEAAGVVLGEAEGSYHRMTSSTTIPAPMSTTGESPTAHL